MAKLSIFVSHAGKDDVNVNNGGLVFDDILAAIKYCHYIESIIGLLLHVLLTVCIIKLFHCYFLFVRFIW